MNITSRGEQCSLYLRPNHNNQDRSQISIQVQAQLPLTPADAGFVPRVEDTGVYVLHSNSQIRLDWKTVEGNQGLTHLNISRQGSGLLEVKIQSKFVHTELCLC